MKLKYILFSILVLLGVQGMAQSFPSCGLYISPPEVQTFNHEGVVTHVSSKADFTYAADAIQNIQQNGFIQTKKIEDSKFTLKTIVRCAEMSVSKTLDLYYGKQNLLKIGCQTQVTFLDSKTLETIYTVEASSVLPGYNVNFENLSSVTCKDLN